MKIKEILVATVGDQPQVVTLALEELLRRGAAIGRVIVVQPSEAQDKIRLAMERLRAEVPHYREKGIEFEFRMFEDSDGYRPADTLDKRDAQIVLRTLNGVLREAKHAGYRVHLSIAGGRKVIAAFGVVAAQLQFDKRDQCWHVGAARRANWEAMRPSKGEQTLLVEVPILSWKIWKEEPPELLIETLMSDPLQAEELRLQLAANAELKRRRDFFHRELDYQEQRAVALLALEGLSNAQLDKRLGIAVKNPLTDALAKYREWAENDDATDRTLIADFHQVMLALQFENQLPDLTPHGAKKPSKSRGR